MNWPSKTLIMISVFINFFLTVLCLDQPGQAAAEEGIKNRKGVISIRNVTNEPIIYWIKREGKEEPQKKNLAIGALHKYNGNSQLYITYKREDKDTTWILERHTPYCFRYDNDHQIQIFRGSHSREDAEDLAPYLATPMELVDQMLALVQIGPKDILYDLGCGDGRIVIKTAIKFQAHGIGIEIDPQLVLQCRQNAIKAGVEHLTSFIQKDVFRVDISNATVVTVYLLPESNERLRPKLENQLKPGTPVITHNYPIPGWQDKEVRHINCYDKDNKYHLIYLYKR